MGSLQPGMPSSTMLPQNWQLAVLDIKDCFFHIPLHLEDAPWFAFLIPTINRKAPMKSYHCVAAGHLSRCREGSRLPIWVFSKLCLLKRASNFYAQQVVSSCIFCKLSSLLVILQYQLLHCKGVPFAFSHVSCLLITGLCYGNTAMLKDSVFASAGLRLAEFGTCPAFGRLTSECLRDLCNVAIPPTIPPFFFLHRQCLIKCSRYHLFALYFVSTC